MNRQSFQLQSAEETTDLGRRIAKCFRGGEILELSGDVGVGKTVLVKGMAQGLGINEVVQSPTYTISQEYEAGDTTLVHYDFYRLNAPGIMREELAESLQDKSNIVAIEWDETVRDILPKERTIQLDFKYTGENSREIIITAPHQMAYIMEGYKN